MAQGYSLHPDGTLAEHTVTNTRAYTEINGLDDGRIMFAIVSFEGVLNFTAEGRLYYRIGAHLLDVDGTLPRSISTPYRDRLSGGRLRRLDTVDFWESSFNDGTTQTALDPLGRGAGSHP